MVFKSIGLFLPTINNHVLGSIYGLLSFFFSYLMERESMRFSLIPYILKIWKRDMLEWARDIYYLYNIYMLMLWMKDVRTQSYIGNKLFKINKLYNHLTYGI